MSVTGHLEIEQPGEQDLTQRRVQEVVPAPPRPRLGRHCLPRRRVGRRGYRRCAERRSRPPPLRGARVNLLRRLCGPYLPGLARQADAPKPRVRPAPLPSVRGRFRGTGRRRRSRAARRWRPRSRPGCSSRGRGDRRLPSWLSLPRTAPSARTGARPVCPSRSQERAGRLAGPPPTPPGHVSGRGPPPTRESAHPRNGRKAKPAGPCAGSRRAAVQ
jgi:hypothetical protein